MNDNPDMTDEQRILTVEAAYSAMPDYQRNMHRVVQDLLAGGMPMDHAVEETAGLIMRASRSHDHPVARAAAILWSLDRLPRWVYTPFDEGAPPAVAPVLLPGLGVPADLIREAIWTALDAETAYHAEMHQRVRQILTMTDPDTAFDRLMALAVETARAKYDHYAGRAAEIGWHAMMIPKWLAEPAAGEN